MDFLADERKFLDARFELLQKRKELEQEGLSPFQVVKQSVDLFDKWYTSSESTEQILEIREMLQSRHHNVKYLRWSNRSWDELMSKSLELAKSFEDSVNVLKLVSQGSGLEKLALEKARTLCEQELEKCTFKDDVEGGAFRILCKAEDARLEELFAITFRRMHELPEE